MVEPKTTADNAEEFKNAWDGHINQLYKLGQSIPDEELEDFMEAVENVEDFVDVAADHTFNK